jgi:hypothetical protein
MKTQQVVTRQKMNLLRVDLVDVPRVCEDITLLSRANVDQLFNSCQVFPQQLKMIFRSNLAEIARTAYPSRFIAPP